MRAALLVYIICEIALKKCDRNGRLLFKFQSRKLTQFRWEPVERRAAKNSHREGRGDVRMAVSLRLFVQLRVVPAE